jgi:hypothetical protein
VLLSLFCLVVVGAAACVTLGRAPGLVLTLVLAFTLYIYRAAYVQAEVLYYTSSGLVFIGALALLRRPVWWGGGGFGRGHGPHVSDQGQHPPGGGVGGGAPGGAVRLGVVAGAQMPEQFAIQLLIASPVQTLNNFHEHLDDVVSYLRKPKREVERL